MNPPQDKNQSPPSHHQDSYSERVVPSKDKMADTEDNLKKEIEPKIDIEGINIKKLKKEDINFYFEMLPWQRDSFRKYIKEAKSETLKNVFEEIDKILNVNIKEYKTQDEWLWSIPERLQELTQKLKELETKK